MGTASANADAVPSCAAVPKHCVVQLQSPEQRSTLQTALDHTDNGLCLICDANLDFPFLADSITDFWRRWHISMGTWFRDYVYIPLGGNKGGLAKQLRNIAIVWLLTGFWHGASWNFVLWGVYFGVLLVAEKLFLLRWLKKLPNPLRHIYALVLVTMSWTFFAFTDIHYFFSSNI